MPTASKTVKVRYTGPADVRKILKSDFAQPGVELDHEAVEFSSKNGFTSEVSEDVAKYLVERDGTGFELVTDEAK